MGLCTSKKPAVVVDSDPGIAYAPPEQGSPIVAAAEATGTPKSSVSTAIGGAMGGAPDDHADDDVPQIAVPPSAELSVDALQQLKAESAFELRDEGGYAPNGCDAYADDRAVSLTVPPTALRAVSHTMSPRIFYDPSIAGEAAWTCLPAATRLAYTQKAYLEEGSWRRPFTRGDEQDMVFLHEAGRPAWDVLPAMGVVENDRLTDAQAAAGQRPSRPLLTEEQRDARLRRIAARCREDGKQHAHFGRLQRFVASSGADGGIVVVEGPVFSAAIARRRTEAAFEAWAAHKRDDAQRAARYWRARGEWFEMQLLSREQHGLATFSATASASTLQLERLVQFDVDYRSTLLLQEVVLKRDLRPAIEKI